ncbi:hypothetical protein [Mesobacillus foraminis]|uniref:hypothetical protein n=1 Tax=Mesobacillus foraminis TaxID=279826 RepID=UPI000EF52439|nr:hypothetical protein [Mesobacillus foraminis]
MGKNLQGQDKKATQNSKKKDPGRPKKKYDEEEVEYIINRYIKENPNVTQISYNTFAKYVQSIKGELKRKYASSFWRSPKQPGRDAIDFVNEKLKQNFVKKTDNKISFYNTEALIDANNGEINKGIIKKLKFNEIQGRNFQERFLLKQAENEQLKDKCQNLEQQLKEKGDFINVLLETLDDVTIVSSSKKAKIKNLFDVTSNRSPFMESVLKFGLGEFSDEVFDSWLKRKPNSEGKELKQNSNVANLMDISSVANDFSF